MTRRITLAILATVWATLIAGGITAYVTTRQVLLENLDQSLVARAASLPDVVDDATGAHFTPLGALSDADRFLVRNEIGQTMARPSTLPAIGGAELRPTLLHAAFTQLPDGTPGRTVTVRTLARAKSAAAAPKPITVTFTSSAADFDRLLNRLGWALLIVCIVGAAVAAAIARLVAIRALQPLRATAEVVGEIDERTLHRRIDHHNLPPELLPVAHKLNQMLERLEDSSRQRRQFIADASHELRTPVAALVTALEVSLRRVRDAESYRETIQTGLTDAQLLQRLVEALLTQIKSELSPADAMQQSDPVQVVDLRQLIGESVQVLSPLAEAKSVQLDVDAEPEMRIRSQPQRLSSILLNLIGNAIEHNRPGGKVTVSCRADAGHVQIEVRDTGVGIAAEHLAHVFEPFYCADAARSSGHLGLGLYLVRTHAQALGGTCDVSSERGVGTTFRIRLPAHEIASPVSGESNRSPDNAAVAKT